MSLTSLTRAQNSNLFLGERGVRFWVVKTDASGIWMKHGKNCVCAQKERTFEWSTKYIYRTEFTFLILFQSLSFLRCASKHTSSPSFLACFAFAPRDSLRLEWQQKAYRLKRHHNSVTKSHCPSWAAFRRRQLTILRDPARFVCVVIGPNSEYSQPSPNSNLYF